MGTDVWRTGLVTDLSPALRRSRRRRWQRNPRVVAAGVMTAIGGLVVLAGDVYGGLNVGQPTTVQVRAGDSLWNIAAAHYPGADVRDRVDQLIQANHLDGASISPGQTLILPAP